MPETTLILILIVLIIILASLVIRLEYKLKKFLRRTGTENIDSVLSVLDTDLKELNQFKTELESYLKHAEKRIKRSSQGIHTVRFNPFKGNGSGGNQSFATAILNEHGDGVVLSSLYSRDHVSVFAKPIQNFNSEFELTAEEKSALIEAQSKIAN